MGMFGMDKIEGNFCKISRARSTKVETNDDQLKAAYLINLEEFNKNLPPYLSAELKVSKTAIKDMQKNDGVLPAGAEIVENYSIRIR